MYGNDDFDGYGCLRAGVAAFALIINAAVIAGTTISLVDIKWTTDKWSEVSYINEKYPVHYKSTSPLYGDCAVTDVNYLPMACNEAAFQRSLGQEHTKLVIVLAIALVATSALAVFVAKAYPNWSGVNKMVLVLRTFVIALSALAAMYCINTIKDWSAFVTACDGGKSLVAQGYDSFGFGRTWRMIDIALFGIGALVAVVLTLAGNSKTNVYTAFYFALVTASVTGSSYSHDWSVSSAGTAPSLGSSVGWFAAATCSNPSTADQFAMKFEQKTYFVPIRFALFASIAALVLGSFPLARYTLFEGTVSRAASVLFAVGAGAQLFAKATFDSIWNSNPIVDAKHKKVFILRDTQLTYDTHTVFIYTMFLTVGLVMSVTVWNTYYRTATKPKNFGLY